MTEKTKGMLVFIQGRDCTNDGVTSGQEMAVLVGDGIPEITEADGRHPALRLEYDLDPAGAQAGRLMVAKPEWLAKVSDAKAPSGDPFEFQSPDWVKRHKIVNAVAVPMEHTGQRWNMYGGQDVDTSDSRFPFTGPVPVHDRYEG